VEVAKNQVTDWSFFVRCPVKLQNKHIVVVQPPIRLPGTRRSTPAAMVLTQTAPPLDG
jgi:hypothetical protein